MWTSVPLWQCMRWACLFCHNSQNHNNADANPINNIDSTRKAAIPKNGRLLAFNKWASSRKRMTCATIQGKRHNGHQVIWELSWLLSWQDCDRPKSSLLHCCIFHINNYRTVVVTFISAVIALLAWVRVSRLLIRSTIKLSPDNPGGRSLLTYY